MTYGYPAPPPPPSTRRPIRMLVVGIVLAVLGVVGLAVAGGLGLRGTVGAVSDALDVRGRLVAQVDVPGSSTVNLQPGEYVVLALGTGLVSGGTGASSGTGVGSDTGYSGGALTVIPFVVPEVRVTGPAGPVELRAPGASSIVSTPSLDAVAIHSLVIATAGSYSVDVTGPGDVVTTVGLRPAVDVEALLRSTVTWVVVGVGSGLVLLLGIGFTIGGAVRRAQHR